MPIVALTGGIAAGKSTVTAVLEQLGALVVDADVLARQAVQRGGRALAAIEARFGTTVIDASGELDRAALGAIVFSDPIARGDLELIVHPVVQELSRSAFSHASVAAPDRVLVYAIPLLTESARAEEFNLVVVVHAPTDERKRRLREHRALGDAEAAARVAAQGSDEERLALADIVIDASGTEDDTVARARVLYRVLAECWPDRLVEAPARYTTLAP